MTKLQRRELYFQMWTTAVGISELMTAGQAWVCYNIPDGLCKMVMIAGKADIDLYDLPELMALRPYPTRGYWFTGGDWKPRAEILLKAYKATFLTDNPR